MSRAARLGAALEPKVDNVTPGRPAMTTEDPRLVARLRELNRYDLALWHWARANLGASAQETSAQSGMPLCPDRRAPAE